MSLFESVRTELAELIESGRDRVEAGAMKAREAVFKVVLSTVPYAMHVMQDVAASGAEKKQAVHDYLDAFYDRAILPIDLPGPDFILDPALRRLMHKVADELIDGLFDFLSSPEAAGIVAAFQKRR